MAIHLFLSDEACTQLIQQKRTHPHPFVRRKCEALLLKAHGLPTEKVSQICGVTNSTVIKYVREYQESGLESICEIPWSGPVSDLDSFREEIIQSFTEKPPHSSREAQARIEQLTGVKRHLSNIKAFLYRIGMSYRKSAQIPSQTDPQIQEHFKKKAWNLS